MCVCVRGRESRRESGEREGDKWEKRERREKGEGARERGKR